MKTETITIEQFITKHGLRFECQRVGSRPDGLMNECDGQRHFRCRIIATNKERHSESCIRTNDNSPIYICTCRNHAFSLYFSQGSAHTSDPTLADVLDCLAMDAGGYESAYGNGGTRFELWAGEYGYNTDSRKAENIFRTVKRQSEQLKRTLGADAYEELLYSIERL